MVTAAGAPVEMHDLSSGGPVSATLPSSSQLAFQRLAIVSPSFDAAARQLPSRHISVADQEDLALDLVEHQAAHAKRHRPLEQEIDMEETRPQAGPAGLAAFLVAFAHRAKRRWKPVLRLSPIKRKCSGSRISPTSIWARCPTYAIGIWCPSASRLCELAAQPAAAHA